MKISKYLLATFLSLFLSLFLIKANAQTNGIAFSPLKVDFKSTQQVETITINNNSNEQKVYQIDLMQWNQENGKDILSKTKNIIASPLVVRINPRSKQIIRIGTKGIEQTSQEQAYRIIFNQIPLNGPKGVQVLTNISIPIFIQSKNDLELKNVSQYINMKPRSQNGKLTNLYIQNNFNEHIKVVGTKITQNNKTISADKKLNYVLPSKTSDYLLNNISIAKNIPVEIELELQGYENVKKQFIIK